MAASKILAAAALRETPVTSAARTTTGNSGTLTTDYTGVVALRAQLNVTAVTGVAPTLDVIIEDSVDDGANWNEIGRFAQRVVTGRELIEIRRVIGNKMRVRWEVNGTTPSFTFRVDWVADHTDPGSAGTQLVQGTGTFTTDEADRVNDIVPVFASLARTASPITTWVPCEKNRGVILVVNVTAVGAAPSVVFRLKGRVGSPAIEVYLTPAAFAVTAVGLYTFALTPGATAATTSPNQVVNGPSWPEIGVEAVHANADSITYQAQLVRTLG